MSRALHQYHRAFTFRLDLRLPPTIDPRYLSHENEFIDRFIDSFKAKIRHNRQFALRENQYAHDTVVRYVWAREVGQHVRPHYHLVIFLNYEAFCSLGQYSLGRDNMFNRLESAWASALGLIIDDAVGLVEIPAKPYYHIHRDDVDVIAKFFIELAIYANPLQGLLEMAAIDLALVLTVD
ncbi:hypothetical protein AAKU64_004256 [Undibacterium sp. GrIS 1.8]